MSDLYIERRIRLGASLPAPRPMPIPVEILVYTIPPFNFYARPSWKAILTLVSLKHKVSKEAMMSASRSVSLVAARHEAMFLIYTHCVVSFSQVGRWFNRDHSTVMHALRKETAKREP